MGWFSTSADWLLGLVEFSSPSGDGLVHETHFGRAVNEIEFSSPSGDGLVRAVGACRLIVSAIFVPEWGWVGSADFNRNFKKSSNDIDTINNCKQTINYTYPITQTNI